MRSTLFCCQTCIDCFGTKLKDDIAHSVAFGPKNPP
jgi:hypothetical protein